MQPDNPREIVSDKVFDELGQKALADRRQIRQRALLVLVGTQLSLSAILFACEDKDVAVDTSTSLGGQIEGIGGNYTGPASFDALGFGEADVGTNKGSVLGDAKMTVNQMDTEDVMSVVAGKDRGEVLDMRVGDGRLVGVIGEGVISDSRKRKNISLSCWWERRSCSKDWAECSYSWRLCWKF